MVGSYFLRHPVSLQLSLQDRAGLKHSNAGIKCLRRRNIEQCGKIIDRLLIGAIINAGQLKESVDFTSERDSVGPRRIKKRLDAKTVSGEKQSACVCVIDRQGKHATQLANEIQTLFLIKVRQDLCIRVPPKHVAAGF